MLGGRWDLGPSPEMGTEEIRKMIGLFAIVQGFEASRYIGVRFAAERRISTMRIAQIVSTVVFVIFMVTLLLAFLPTPPGVPEDGRAIFAVSDLVGDLLPWLLLLAALGSQASAIIGATSSRSDMLVNNKVPRARTFPIILVPAIMLVIFVDVNVAVNLASRVFAAYFTIQAGAGSWSKGGSVRTSRSSSWASRPPVTVWTAASMRPVSGWAKSGSCTDQRPTCFRMTRGRC